MKILFASITDSGLLRVRSELIIELLKQNDEVVIASPMEKDYKKLIEMGCSFVPVTIQQHGKNPIADISVFAQYIKILKKEKPDVVLLFTTKPNIYCGLACRVLGIKSIMNITGMGAALGNKGILQVIMIQLYKLACNGKNTKKIFFQNDDSKTFFRNNKIGNPDTYYRIPGSGVNLDKFQLQSFPDSSTVDFLFVARVMKQKGIDHYIEAAKIIRKKFPEAIFHVLGGCDSVYKDILEAETQNGTINYHGRINNISDFQKISQCTIQPSYYPEGMSNVILEAAASGRPVITTDHPGCREGVEDGVTGFIVPVKNTAALAEVIENFMLMSVQQRAEMGLRGRQKMEREFDRRIVTSAYLHEVNYCTSSIK